MKCSSDLFELFFELINFVIGFLVDSIGNFLPILGNLKVIELRCGLGHIDVNTRDHLNLSLDIRDSI